MNKNKIAAILHFISSVCFFVCALIDFKDGGNLGAVYLCLGATFLCLGAMYLNKNKSKDDKDN